MQMERMECVASTMDAAKERLRDGRVTFYPTGRARWGGVTAREQTAGRGQRGRLWYAPPGEALNATYYFRRGLTDPSRAGEIAFLAGVAVIEALQKLILSVSWPVRDEDQGVPRAYHRGRLGLKWPNDILLNNKKVGGILVEVVQAADGEWTALIGVGINLTVTEFPTELQDIATSFAREGIEPPDADDLADVLLHSLHAQADKRRDLGFRALLERWRDFDTTPGRTFEAVRSEEAERGVAVGVAEDGSLLLRWHDGSISPVTSATSLAACDA